MKPRHARKRLRELFSQIDRTPHGPEEVALVTEAVALAVDLGDERLEYDARMRQTSSACMAGDTELMLTSFAWCLATHDADPKRFPDEIGSSVAGIMWQFKWMANALSASPGFSLTQIHAVLDDMEEHYRRAGLGLSGVLQARFKSAWSTGDLDAAEELRIRLDATPRDSHSHCDACVRSEAAGFLIDTDREAEGIRLVEELVDGGFTCNDEPEFALSHALVPYLRAGEFDKARHAHARSYRLSSDNPDKLTIVANNIVFCAITGNEARALTLVERHLDWLAHDGLDDDAHLTALAGFSLALDAVAAVGHGDTLVRGADSDRLLRFFGPHDDPWTAADLARATREGAERIAAAFDERNGNDAHTTRLRKTLALRAESYTVPLSTAPEPILARSMAEIPRTPAERAQRALDLSDAQALPEALAAIDDALPDASPADRSRLTGRTVSILMALDREPDAAAALPAAIAATRAEGRIAQATLEERLGLALYGRKHPEDIEALRATLADHAAPPIIRAQVAAILANVAEHSAEALELCHSALQHAHAVLDGDAAKPRAVLSVHSLLALLYAKANDVERCEAEIERILSDEMTGAGRRATLLLLRASVRGTQNRCKEGAADADAACRALVALGAESAFSHPYALAASLHEDAGNLGDAIARFRFAVQSASDPAEAGPLRYRLAQALLTAGASDEAVDILLDLVRDEIDRDEPAASRGQTLMLLARAFEHSGDPERAVHAWRRAAAVFDESGEELGRAHALFNLGKLFAYYGNDDEATTPLTTALEVARRRPDEIGFLANTLLELGGVRASQRDEQAFTLLDEVLTIARQHDATILQAAATRSRAYALSVFDRTDEAISTALEAADAFTTIGDTENAVGSELLAARVLTRADRHADAVPIYRSILDRYAEIPHARQIAAIELGDALETLGRVAEAAEVRATIEA